MVWAGAIIHKRHEFITSAGGNFQEKCSKEAVVNFPFGLHRSLWRGGTPS